MFDINTILRENIKVLKPYTAARDEYKGTEGTFLDANENAFGSAPTICTIVIPIRCNGM